MSGLWLSRARQGTHKARARGNAPAADARFEELLVDWLAVLEALLLQILLEAAV
jgi:hypothetical protein